ncbi:MAG: hypothetical protein RBR77_16260 [Thauera sp.]|jgi:hypothetical protein|nr:hypothetical protein [Thauera sp.]
MSPGLQEKPAIKKDGGVRRSIHALAFLPSFPCRRESRLFVIAPAVLDARLRGHDGGLLRIFSLLDTWSERLLDAESIDEMFKKC